MNLSTSSSSSSSSTTQTWSEKFADLGYSENLLNQLLNLRSMQNRAKQDLYDALLFIEAAKLVQSEQFIEEWQYAKAANNLPAVFELLRRNTFSVSEEWTVAANELLTMLQDTVLDSHIQQLKTLCIGEGLLNKIIKQTPKRDMETMFASLTTTFSDLQNALSNCSDEFVARWTSVLLNDDLDGLQRILLEEPTPNWKNAALVLYQLLDRLSVFRSRAPSNNHYFFSIHNPQQLAQLNTKLRYLIHNAGADNFAEIAASTQAMLEQIPKNTPPSLLTETTQLLFDVCVIQNDHDSIVRFLSLGITPSLESLNRAIFSGAHPDIIVKLIHLGGLINADTLNCALLSTVDVAIIHLLLNAGAEPNEETPSIIQHSAQHAEILCLLKGSDAPVQPVSYSDALLFCRTHFGNLIAKYCQPTSLINAIGFDQLEQNILGLDLNTQRCGSNNNDDDNDNGMNDKQTIMKK